MTLIEEIEHIRHGEDTVPCGFHITKEAEENLYFFARQMDRTEDDTLDLLLRYLALTDNCIKVLDDLGYEFDPSKAT